MSFDGVATFAEVTDAVANLRERGDLVQADAGWQIEGNAKLSDLLGRGRVRSYIETVLAQGGGDESLIGVAACLGERFPVRVLARAIQKTPMECLVDLERLAGEVGIFRDIQEDEEHFAFRSHAVFDTVRNLFGLDAATSDLSKRARYCFEGAAQALEQEGATNWSDQPQLFKLYARVGSRGKSKAVEYGLESARVAIRVEDFVGAEHLLDEVEPIAREASRIPDVLIERDRLKLERDFVQGHGRRSGSGPTKSISGGAKEEGCRRRCCTPPCVICSADAATNRPVGH